MEINLFKPGNFANGHISSSSGKSYKTLTEALCNGRERIKDCRVEWDYLKSNIPEYKNLDELYDEQMIHLRASYDILELSWGGGYDSSYLLEIAYRNEIKLDMISMMGVESLEKEHPWNKEFHWNWKHVERYLDKFPNTQIKFMDFGSLWNIVKAKKLDWTTSKAGLEDICGLASDDYLGRDRMDNRALLTGRGWKKILYNKKYDIWSTFQGSDYAHSVLCYSDVADVVYFFGSPEIIKTQCSKARTIALDSIDLHNISQGDVWVSDDVWMQREVMYRKLPFGIRRFPKQSNDFLGQFDHPKMSWYCKNGLPVDQDLHKEYWEYLDKLNKNIHIDDLGGVSLPNGIFPDIVKTVDF